MFDPAIGIRGKIRVLGEDIGGRDVLFQLHEKALLTHPGVQREERLHMVELVRFNMRLTQRRHAEIDEARVKRVAAKPAACSIGPIGNGDFNRGIH